MNDNTSSGNSCSSKLLGWLGDVSAVTAVAIAVANSSVS